MCCLPLVQQWSQYWTLWTWYLSFGSHDTCKYICYWMLKLECILDYFRTYLCVCVCVCVCISYKWLTSKQQRPTWEVKGSSAGQIIPRIFLNPKVQYVFTIARHFSWSRFRSSQSTTLPFVPSHDFPINNQYKAFRLKNFIELASIIPIQVSKKIVKVLRLPVKEKLPKNKVGRPLS